MKWALVFLAIIATASAAIIVPVTPPACPNGYALLNPDAAAHATSDFAPNLFHYNTPPQDLKGGAPRGPYFKLEADSVWNINGSFHASLTIYAEATLLHPIGSATLDSDAFFLGVAPKNLSFGSLTLVSTIDASLAAAYYPKATASAAENKNWKSQTAVLGFRARQEATSQYGPNTVHSEKGALILRLWGSSGYVASTDSFSASGRGVGFDLWASLVCLPSEPIIPPGICPDSPSDAFTLSYAASRGGQLVERSSTGTAISVKFSA